MQEFAFPGIYFRVVAIWFAQHNIKRSLICPKQPTPYNLDYTTLNLQHPFESTNPIEIVNNRVRV